MGLITAQSLPLELQLQASLESDPDWQDLEWLQCAESIRYWSDVYVWTFDPRDHIQPVKRFPRWPFILALDQMHEERLAGLHPERRHIAVEKARATAFSWTGAKWATHGLCFRYPWSGWMMSYLFRRIDDGGKRSTPNSLIGKIRAIWGRMPAWQRARAPLHFTRGTVTNLATGATLVAEVAGETTARGTQGDEGFIDEAGYAPHLDMILASAGPATKFLTVGGTPNGEGTDFDRLCKDAGKGEGNYRKIEIEFWHVQERRACVNCGSTELRTPESPEDRSYLVHRREDCIPENGLHWDEVRGRLNSPWLEREAGKLTETLILQEYFRSHGRNRLGLVWPVFKPHRHAHEENDLKLDGWDHVCTWDYGVRDMASVGWGQRRGERIEVFDDHETNQVSYEYWCEYIAWMRGEFHEWGEDGKPKRFLLAGQVDRRTKSAAARVWERQWGEPGRYRAIRQLTHVGDPSGKAVDSSLGSWEANLRKGSVWTVDGREVALGRVAVASAYSQIQGRVSEAEKIQAVEFLLERDRLGVHPRAQHTIAALAGYHWKVNRQGKVLVSSDGPAHDEFSHSADRLGYMAIFCFGRIGSGGMPSSR